MPETKETSPAEVERENWEEQTLKPALDKHPERKKSFQTVSLEEVERLYAALRQLPEAEVALVLLYLDDLSYRQMAEVLGISESNVGVKLNRAKKALAELMKEEPHGP